eukprot:TRINITY_DN441_c1_g1_i1.p1 TRINITY_DN441_c1_g1~~TRINITY_DN441_c1_g1_i1.p1  ORF type:complete len:567 (+),score=129.36 TRINITY_DN441_c1_g1_i1:121-1821(+)
MDFTDGREWSVSNLRGIDRGSSPRGFGSPTNIDDSCGLLLSPTVDRMAGVMQRRRQQLPTAPVERLTPVAFVDNDGDTNRFELLDGRLWYVPPFNEEDEPPERLPHTDPVRRHHPPVVRVVPPPAVVQRVECDELIYNPGSRELVAAGWTIGIREDAISELLLLHLSALAIAADAAEDLQLSVSPVGSGSVLSLQSFNQASRGGTSGLTHHGHLMHPAITPGAGSSVRSEARSLANNPIWRVGRKLGAGGFGVVYQLVEERSGVHYAAKCLANDNLQQLSPRDQQRMLASFEQEVATLSKLAHPNIVQYFGFERIRGGCYIILEYVSGGSVWDLMMQLGGPLGESLAQRITRQALSGLGYLHSQDIIHRDIKAANLLTDTNGDVKLADFGCATTEMRAHTGDAGSTVGTVPFMAPEVLTDQVYSTKSDIWAIGCTVCEMLTGSHPFCTLKRASDDILPFLRQVKEALARGNTPLEHLPQGVRLSPDATGFARDCFRACPDDRFSCAELLQHDFLNECNSDYGEQSTLSPLFRNRPKPGEAFPITGGTTFSDCSAPPTACSPPPTDM